MSCFICECFCFRDKEEEKGEEEDEDLIARAERDFFACLEADEKEKEKVGGLERHLGYFN